MKFYTKYILRLLFIFSILIGCKKAEKQVETTTSNTDTDASINISEEQFESEKMKLATLQNHSFPVYIKTTGIIDVPPSSKAIINTYMGGYIKKSTLLIGDKVKKGQAIVTIENIDFIKIQQEYLEAHEQLIYLKAEYERKKELFDEQISSKKSFLKAESDYKKTKALHNALRKKLQLLNINIASVEKNNFSSTITLYAPISGYISDVNVSTGTYVSPADEIMEIVNTEHIHLELKVFEKDVLKIQKGQKVIFKVSEYSSESFEGDIHLIGKSINEDRTVQVHAHIDHKVKRNFIVGMFVETDIIIDDSAFIALPETAIIEVNNKNYVLVLKSKSKENYSFFKREVKIGKTYNGFTKIIKTNTFKENEQFLLGGFALISEEE